MSASAELIFGLSLERGQLSPHEALSLQVSRIGMKESRPSRLDTVKHVLHLVEDTLGLAPSGSPPAVVDALRVLKSELFRAYATPSFPAPPNADFIPSRFTVVFEHIEENLDGDVTLVNLASLVGLSVSRFSHTFKAAFGVAPYRYILQRRLAKAKALLRNSEATIAEIAACVGFSSQSRFSQMFAQSTGVTPSAYREHGALRRREGMSTDEPLTTA
jgi:transcriptional regulator GlxA family with amidase domain